MYKKMRVSLLASPLLACVLMTSPVGAADPKAAADVRSGSDAVGTSDADWPRFGRSWQENHYSPLRQINATNVNELGLAWYLDLPEMFSSGVSSPVAADGVLYYAVAHSYLYAVDAVSGKVLWTYDPKVSEHGGTELRGAWGVRGIVYGEGRVYAGTADGRLIAVDAASGKLLWSAQTTEDGDGRYITGMPYLIGDNVIIGHGGADFSPVRGYVTAYDRVTGKQAWRFYTVPGNPADGFESEAMKMAAQTWTGQWWKDGGGGTVWNAMAYDPELNLVYIGVGNGAPDNQKLRSPEGGDNLFLSSIVALDANTGEYRWHYQSTPGETWDFTATMDIELADLEINGQPRKVLMQAPKNGFFYILDRATGELLSAEPFARITWAERVDMKTGRPVEVEGARFPNGSTFLAYPSLWGAHGVEAMSYNPETGLVYLPARDKGFYFADPEDLESWDYVPDRKSSYINQGYGAGKGSESRPKLETASWLAAWDPVAQREVWRVERVNTHNGGTMTTAGNLVMQGLASGKIVIYSADKGKELWSFDAHNGVMGHPISYLADGQQYISLLVGWRASTHGEGEYFWPYRGQQRRLMTFRLGGKEQLPPSCQQPLPVLAVAGFAVDPAKAAAGNTLYHLTCGICHGGGVVSGGAAPDLTTSPIVTNRDALRSVLHDGLLASRGMPRYAELDDRQIEDLMHYIRQVTNQRLASQSQ
ncbi:MAG: PQQ-dependent dehydrogenase, methanol/ethanol family [Parahaliea sp.]